MASIEGCNISLEQKYRIGVICDHLRYIEKLIERVDICINTMVKKYEGVTSLLCTIPGIGCSSAITIISEISMDKTNPYYALKYERIVRRRGRKRAVIAIARMTLTAIYSMLFTGEIWNPTDLFKVDMPRHLKVQQLQKTMKQAVRFLEVQGFKVS